MQLVYRVIEICYWLADSRKKEQRNDDFCSKKADMESSESIEPTSRDIPKSLNENHDATATEPTSAGGSLGYLSYKLKQAFCKLWSYFCSDQLVL